MVPASRTIRVDPEVRSELCRQAEAAHSTPNQVLRRVLGLPPGPRQRRGATAVLAVLAAKPGSTAAVLAAECGLAYSTVTAILADLETSGLATSRPGPPKAKAGRTVEEWTAVPLDHPNPEPRRSRRPGPQ